MKSNINIKELVVIFILCSILGSVLFGIYFGITTAIAATGVRYGYMKNKK